MILRSPAKNEIPSAPQAVIPAHAGIQVYSADLAWIPAFAGMTIPGSLLIFILIPGIFEEGHEGKTFVGADLRVRPAYRRRDRYAKL
jgi:hypothetical protein